MKDSCVLWQRAKDVAEVRGLEMSRQCPMESICEGTRCTMISPIKLTAESGDKFYIKLQKHEDKVKLNALREELKNYA